MTRFIQQSACEGRRPHGVVPDRLRSRPRLLSRLLEDRGALRLVVAPPGFGKATLAFEYASVMFQFEHVFWLRGSSPCFLRDLDAGVLAEAVLEADEHAALMVVADLPLLTDDRAEAFAEVVERLADASCEVIATTTRADAPMELFGRRVVIEAAEMLVAREDLEEEPEGVTDRRPLGLAERIAALHAIVERYAAENLAHFDAALASELSRTLVWKITPNEVTAKAACTNNLRRV